MATFAEPRFAGLRDTFRDRFAASWERALRAYLLDPSPQAQADHVPAFSPRCIFQLLRTSLESPSRASRQYVLNGRIDDSLKLNICYSEAARGS